MNLCRSTCSVPCLNCGNFTKVLIETDKKVWKCGKCVRCVIHKNYNAIRKPKVDCAGCKLKWRLVHGRL